MELKFIWIKDYKNLKNIGFNFNASSNVSFDYINEELIISSKKINLPQGFFSKNIKEVTAIVGENGSGKTNFSEFLNYNLAHARNNSLTTYFESNGILIIDKIIFYQEKIIIKNSKELKDLGFELSPFDLAPLDTKPKEIHWSELERNRYIYFNPVFDFRVLPMRMTEVFNISTNYLAFNDKYYSSKHFTKKESSFDKTDPTDSLSAYYKNEKLRESDFILNFPQIAKDLGKFKSFSLSLDDNSDNKILDYGIRLPISNSRKTEAIRYLNEQLQELLNTKKFKRFQTEGDEEYFYDYYLIPPTFKRFLFFKLFLIKFCIVFIWKHGTSFKNNFLENFILDSDFSLSDPELEKKLKLIRILLKRVLKISIWQQGVQKIQKLSQNYDKNIYSIFREFDIDIDSNSKINLVKDLIELTKDILDNNLHIQYQFNHSLSSGQQSMLNFYSRFYWVANEIQVQEKKELFVNSIERIVIFIDEGEVSLHPEWQRSYFKLAIDYLSKLFENKEIQLILTTHSPFVLSELPKENIIFLNKNNEGFAEISNIERENTFGANIYSLLADSFFMKSGTIGEFALDKITWVLNKLNNQKVKISEEEIKEINFIINNVGEPLIKIQLESLREKRLNISEIEEMRKRIKELENKLKIQNNDNDKE